MKRIAFTLALFTLCTTPAAGQFGPLVDEGFGIGSNLSVREEGTGVGVTTGYVFSAPIETGVTAGRFWSEFDTQTSRIGPYAAIYPLRTLENPPFSLSLSGSFQWRDFGRVVTQGGRAGDVTGTTATISLGLFRSFQAGKTVQIVPSVAAGYVRSEAEATVGGRTISASPEESSVFVGGVSFVFQASEALGISTSPSVTMQDGDPTLGLSVSLLVPQ